MSRPNQRPLGLGCYGLLLCLMLVPAHFLYWFGGQGYRVDEDAAILAAAARKKAVIDEALKQERAEAAALQRRRDELRRKLAQTSEQARDQLRGKIARQKESISDYDRLLLDASVGLEDLVLHQVRAALPEVEGVELSLTKGRRAFELVLDFTKLHPVEAQLEAPAQPDFAPLAEALSKFPGKQLRHWLENLYLARAGGHRYPQRFLKLSAPAWLEFLQGYQRPHWSSGATYVDNLYGQRKDPKLSELHVTLHESVSGPHTLTIVGPQRVKGRVEPGQTFSCELQEGAYVVRSEGPTPEDTIYLHLLDFGPRRKVKFTFEPRK